MTEATAQECLKAMNTRFASLAKAAPQAMGAFRNLCVPKTLIRVDDVMESLKLAE